MNYRSRKPTDVEKSSKIEPMSKDPVTRFVIKSAFNIYATIFIACLVLWAFCVFVFVPARIVSEGYKAVTGKPLLEVLGDRSDRPDYKPRRKPL